ncbi:MAG: hypothetical protein WCF33_06280 [Pseudonocardiaceae bacterium]
MPSIEETVRKIRTAPTWDKRVAQIRLVAQNHGTADHPRIWAQVAREGYVSDLAPDFAYIHEAQFYETDYFREVYSATIAATDNFAHVDAGSLTRVLESNPRTLLVLRTVVGLTKQEFAHSTTLVAEARGWRPLSPDKIDAMEKQGTPTTTEQAQVAALTLHEIMAGSLFPEPGANLRSKQTKSAKPPTTAAPPETRLRGSPHCATNPSASAASLSSPSLAAWAGHGSTTP